MKSQNPLFDSHSHPQVGNKNCIFFIFGTPCCSHACWLARFSVVVSFLFIIFRALKKLPHIEQVPAHWISSSTLKKPLTCLFDPVLHRRRCHDLDLSKDYPFFNIDIDIHTGHDFRPGQRFRRAARDRIPTSPEFLPEPEPTTDRCLCCACARRPPLLWLLVQPAAAPAAAGGGITQQTAQGRARSPAVAAQRNSPL